MIPLRFLFRSRWMALAWAMLICVRVADFAERQKAGSVDAANAVDSAASQSHAAAAEDG